MVLSPTHIEHPHSVPSPNSSVNPSQKEKTCFRLGLFKIGTGERMIGSEKTLYSPISSPIFPDLHRFQHDLRSSSWLRPYQEVPTIYKAYIPTKYGQKCGTNVPPSVRILKISHWYQALWPGAKYHNYPRYSAAAFASAAARFAGSQHNFAETVGMKIYVRGFP